MICPYKTQNTNWLWTIEMILDKGFSFLLKIFNYGIFNLKINLK